MFNSTVQMDFFKVALRTGSATVAHMIDQASRYQVARLVQTESTEEAIIAFQRGWVRQFGIPRRLLVDEGRAFCSQDMIDHMDQLGVKLIIAPGEAHHWLGMVERAHAVLREALDVFLESEDKPRTWENL